MILLPYTFRKLLKSLEDPRQAKKLAMMARQVKIEQPLLAEIMFNGNELFTDLEFYLEEQRRDLTIRRRRSDSDIGPLIDWVEAKMCFTDCLARSLTRHAPGRRFEYRDLLRADAERQQRGLSSLPPEKRADSRAQLTSLLFAIHQVEPVRRQKYYPGFKNRGRHSHSEIEQAACQFVCKKIAPFIQRDVVEHIKITLDEGCRLHVFVLRAPRNPRSRLVGSRQRKAARAGPGGRHRVHASRSDSYTSSGLLTHLVSAVV